jgi:hypothetical protein
MVLAAMGMVVLAATKGDEGAAGADGGSGGDVDEVGNRFGVWSRSGLDREALRRLF